MILNLVATGLCKLQINQMTQMDVFMNGEDLAFPVSGNAQLLDMKTNYDQGVSFSISYSGSFSSYWNVDSATASISMSGTSAKIQISIQSVIY